jgi:hypothetical protein
MFFIKRIYVFSGRFSFEKNVYPGVLERMLLYDLKTASLFSVIMGV